MNRKLFSILWAMTLASVNFGQTNKNEEFLDGWVLTKKGDTLKGQICYMNSKSGEIYQNEKKITFIDLQGVKKKMGSEKLTSFSVDNRILEYHALDPDLEPFLLEKIIDGEIQMYKGWFTDKKKSDKKFIYEEAIFIKRQDDNKFTEVLQKDFKKIMKKFFKGDEKIMDMISENGWTAFDIEKIVTAINKGE